MGCFDKTIGIDQNLSCRCIYKHSVFVMRNKQLMDWMKHAQLSMCCNHKWLKYSMSMQPVVSKDYLGKYHEPIKEKMDFH